MVRLLTMQTRQTTARASSKAELNGKATELSVKTINVDAFGQRINTLTELNKEQRGYEMLWILIILGTNGHAATVAEFAREDLCRQAAIQVNEAKSWGNYKYQGICVKRGGL